VFLYLLLVVLAVVALLGATSPVAGASPAAAAAAFKVSSTAGWQQTTINLTAGDTYRGLFRG
jgi:hypothetical protein